MSVASYSKCLPRIFNGKMMANTSALKHYLYGKINQVNSTICFYNFLKEKGILILIINPCDLTVCYFIWPCDIDVHITWLFFKL